MNSLYLLGILKENIGFFFFKDNYLTYPIKLGAEELCFYQYFKQDNFFLYVIVTIF